MGNGRKRRTARGYIVVGVVIVLAMAGSATADRIITSADVRNNSLTGWDVKNRSLTPRDFRGSVRGPAGPAGPTGEAGPTGATGAAGEPGVVAYAKIVQSGPEDDPIYEIDDTRSKNVTFVSRTGSQPIQPFPGVVCLEVSVPVDVAVVTVDNTDPLVFPSVQMPVTPGADRCSFGTDAAVILRTIDGTPTGAGAEASFYVMFS